MRKLFVFAVLGLVACEGPEGPKGEDGVDGVDGADGSNGSNGADGQDGADAPVVVPDASIPDYVKRLVDEYARGTIDSDIQFPLLDAWTDTVRTIEGVQHNVVVRWLDPITDDGSLVWGSNNDYLAYVGDGFEYGTSGTGPQAAGSSNAGWLWSNFEYISNDFPSTARSSAVRPSTRASPSRCGCSRTVSSTST